MQMKMQMEKPYGLCTHTALLLFFYFFCWLVFFVYIAIVILGGADAEDCTEESADDRDGSRNLSGIGKFPNLGKPGVERTDGWQNDDGQVL